MSGPNVTGGRIADEGRRSRLSVGHNHGFADVIERADIPSTANHVLASGELDKPSANIIVVLSHRIR